MAKEDKFIALLYDTSDPARLVARIKVPSECSLVLYDSRYFVPATILYARAEYPFYEVKAFAATSADVL